MQRDPRAWLWDVREAAQAIEAFVTGLEADGLTSPRLEKADSATPHCGAELSREPAPLPPLQPSPRFQSGDAVRAKLAQLGLTKADVADAVRWARESAAGHRVAAPLPI
jgi:hypothetical protein